MDSDDIGKKADDKRRNIKIKYDMSAKNMYYMLANSEKFLNADRDILCISVKTDSELEKIADKQVGEKFVFTSEYEFDTKDLNNILRVHIPEEATAYHDKCIKNVLTVRFYKI